MIKVAQIQLKPDIRQQEILTETLRTANKACDEISSVIFEEKLFVSRHLLQQKTYYPIRAKYPSLSAQMVLHCVFKVFDSYKKVRKLAAEEITRVGRFTSCSSLSVTRQHPWEWQWCLSTRTILPSAAASVSISNGATADPNPNSAVAGVVTPNTLISTRRKLSEYWGYVNGPMVVRSHGCDFNCKLPPGRR